MWQMSLREVVMMLSVMLIYFNTAEIIIGSSFKGFSIC